MAGTNSSAIAYTAMIKANVVITPQPSLPIIGRPIVRCIVVP